MIDNIKQRFIELAGPEPKDHLNRVKWNHRLEGFRLAFKDQEPFGVWYQDDIAAHKCAVAIRKLKKETERADFGWQNVRILEKARVTQDASYKALLTAILSLNRNLYNDYQWEPLAKIVKLAKELRDESVSS